MSLFRSSKSVSYLKNLGSLDTKRLLFILQCVQSLEQSMESGEVVEFGEICRVLADLRFSLGDLDTDGYTTLYQDLQLLEVS